MSEGQTVVFKKVKKVSGGGHHGGAWKVAYADFVTAMMAFFLLMWLLNATSEDQRKGLADYFDPSIPISKTSGGGAGVLGGDTMFVPPDSSGSRDEGIRPQPTDTDAGQDLGELSASPDQPIAETAPDTVPVNGGAQGADGEDSGSAGGNGADGEDGETSGDDGDATRSAAAEFADVQEDLLETVRQAGQDGILEHFTMRMTPEGLVIEIVDVADEPLFRSGAPSPEPVLERLIDIIVPVLQKTTNDIAVAGHTDATPFANRTDYSNWELSSERANAARRLLGQRGLEAERIVRVSGRAATDPISGDPFAPENRRIALTLLRHDENRPRTGQ